MNATVTRHAVLILAAGRSRRLGFPKQRLRVRGESLLARTVRIAASTRPAHVLVALPAHDPGLAGEVDAALASHVLVDDDTHGKASTLAHAAHCLPRDVHRVLILCADHPALDAMHLVCLLDAADAATSGLAATAYPDAMGEPAVVPLARLLAFTPVVHGQGLRAMLQGSDVARVPAPAPLAGVRVDTPALLQEARRAGWVDAAS